MVIPIVLPPDDSGHLTVFPDSRAHRRSAIASALEKLLVQGRFHQRKLKRRFESRPDAYTIPLTLGDAYVFRGYRSLHGTLPWPKGTLRVTLVLQYGHPYGPEGSILCVARACLDELRSLRRAG